MAAGSFSGDVGAGLQLGIKDNNIFGSGNMNYIFNNDENIVLIFLLNTIL